MEVKVDGVFPNLVDERCFLDRVVVGVWGKPRQQIGSHIEATQNLGIAGPSSPYARVVKGKCKLSGNSVQWKYGRYLRTRWSHLLPPYQFAMKSDEIPVTCAGFLYHADERKSTSFSTYARVQMHKGKITVAFIPNSRYTGQT
jgi:hypothetical protein